MVLMTLKEKAIKHYRRLCRYKPMAYVRPSPYQTKVDGQRVIVRDVKGNALATFTILANGELHCVKEPKAQPVSIPLICVPGVIAS
jgi:hypothetical protein